MSQLLWFQRATFTFFPLLVHYMGVVLNTFIFLWFIVFWKRRMKAKTTSCNKRNAMFLLSKCHLFCASLQPFQAFGRISGPGCWPSSVRKFRRPAVTRGCTGPPRANAILDQVLLGWNHGGPDVQRGGSSPEKMFARAARDHKPS